MELKQKNLLIIVESPNKCTTISNILKKAGYTNAKVVASYGHIMELGDGGPYHNSGIDPQKEFSLNLKVSSSKTDMVRKLKAYAKEADLVYLMTDQDREGELIAWSLIQFLSLPTAKCVRATTHEITPKAVVYAIEHPIALSSTLIDAALARLTIDKMIGYTLSPVAKAYLSARSVGRCQSAGLKLVVDREREIQNFVPEYYYDLFLQFSKNAQIFKAKYVGTLDKLVDRITDSEQLTAIKAECKGDYTVQDIKQRTKKESPKPPFCTATFQQEAAAKLGLKVKDAMSCAQKLFEGLNVNGEHLGLITYMRTDATDLAPEFLPELEQYIIATYGKGQYCVPKAGTKSATAQEGHEALRVVDPTLTPEKLKQYLSNELLLKVYELIWKRTIASALKPAELSETTYTINNNRHLFKLVSTELRKPGYRVVYRDEPVSEAALTEIFELNEILTDPKLIELPKQTQPPTRFKEGTLIKELQKCEIGRPSTYATIIETVLSPNRGYCVLEDKFLVPTERGMQLSGFLDRSFSEIISLDYTKTMEADLDKIASGKLSRLNFLQAFYSQLEHALAANKETAGDTLQLDSKVCPNCQANMVIRRSRFGKLFYGCSRYPNCRGIIGID